MLSHLYTIKSIKEAEQEKEEIHKIIDNADICLFCSTLF